MEHRLRAAEPCWDMTLRGHCRGLAQILHCAEPFSRRLWEHSSWICTGTGVPDGCSRAGKMLWALCWLMTFVRNTLRGDCTPRNDVRSSKYIIQLCRLVPCGPNLAWIWSTRDYELSEELGSKKGLKPAKSCGGSSARRQTQTVPRPKQWSSS